MYIRITTRCNMLCGHCGGAYGPRGRDMAAPVYKAALELCMDRGEGICLGGGEPTVHPEFWPFLTAALMATAVGELECPPWLATNGKETQTAITLAYMAKRGVIGCALSRDRYHEDIDPDVVRAFDGGPRYGMGGPHDRIWPNDFREVRCVDGKEVRAGRCRFGREGCLCSEIIVEPSGKIKGCGCPDAPLLGTVEEPRIPDDWETGNCFKNQPDDVLESCHL